MKIRAASVFLLLPLLSAAPPVRAEDYQGAEAVLRRADELADKAAEASESGKLRRWHADLQTYRSRAATLPPDEAARGWLGLLDRARKLPDPDWKNGGGFQSPVDYENNLS